jgi:hypothetical protein
VLGGCDWEGRVRAREWGIGTRRWESDYYVRKMQWD